MKNRVKSKRKSRILISSGFAATVFITAVCAPSIAKYVKSTKNVENTFSFAGYDTPKVIDEVSSDENNMFYKNNVVVEVSDNGYPVYVRVDLVVTWQDENSNVYWKSPLLGTDYTLEYNEEYWTEDGGYFYYNNVVESGGETEPLIREDQKLIQLDYAPTGYTMHVEVVCETIQAVGKIEENGEKAVKDAWSVDLYDEITDNST